MEKIMNMDPKKLAIAGVVLVVGLTYIGTAFGYRTDCVRAEAGLKAQQDQLRNNYDNMWKKIKEIAQVPAMQAEDFKKVYDGVMQGRYGAEGSKAMFQWIQEHNPQLGTEVYTQLQRTIESARNGFEADQKQILDMKRAYEVVLNSNRALMAGFWFSFPKLDMNSIKILTSDQTEEAFRAGKADEIKLR